MRSWVLILQNQSSGWVVVLLAWFVVGAVLVLEHPIASEKSAESRQCHNDQVMRSEMEAA
jgi:hypothetical protein